MGVRIFINCARPYFSKRNTDWAMKCSLQYGLSQFGAFYPRDIIWILFYNLNDIVARFIPRRWFGNYKNISNKIRARLVERYSPDIYVTQGPDPALPRNCKIIWETFFLPESRSQDQIREFRRGRVISG